MLSKVNASGTAQYGWNYENRLTSATVPDASSSTTGATTVASFRYDPFGRRIQKTTSSGSTVYLYDGANIVAELDGGGAYVAKYTQGAGVDEQLAMKRGGYVEYYHADALGSITSLTGATGQLTATYTYDAFGNTTATEGIHNPFRYTGREHDTETGLYYYRARYYDPSIGRFLSEDPIRFWGGIDFYKYANNQPTNQTDPSGEVPFPIIFWGNWCGPNWTGGRFEQYDPSHAKIDGYYKEPVGGKGGADYVCQKHDVCYYQCRHDNPCDKGKRTKCMSNCDSVLVANMPTTGPGPVIGFGLSLINNPPDSGDDAGFCSCKDKNGSGTWNWGGSSIQ